MFAGYTCHLQFSVLGTSSPGVLHRTWLRLVLVAGAGVVVVLGGAVVESSHTPAGRWSVQQVWRSRCSVSSFFPSHDEEGDLVAFVSDMFQILNR